MSVFHDRTIPDGNVHLVKTGKYDASEQPGRYHFSIPWIRCRTCGVYVLRLCKKYSDRDRRGGDDRWMYSDPDILSGGISNYETNGDHRCNFTGNVDLERLFTSLSGIGYQKIQDDSNRHSVLKRWLWSSRLGYIDMGAMMAMLVLAIVPIVVFYVACQKYIIEGVVAGAVKG